MNWEELNKLVQEALFAGTVKEGKRQWIEFETEGARVWPEGHAGRVSVSVDYCVEIATTVSNDNAHIVETFDASVEVIDPTGPEDDKLIGREHKIFTRSRYFVVKKEKL